MNGNCFFAVYHFSLPKFSWECSYFRLAGETCIFDMSNLFSFLISNSGPTLSVSQSFLVLKGWVGSPAPQGALSNILPLSQSTEIACWMLFPSASLTLFRNHVHTSTSLPHHPPRDQKSLRAGHMFYSSMDPHHVALVHRRCSKISDGLINKWSDDRRDKACTSVIPKEEFTPWQRPPRRKTSS